MIEGITTRQDSNILKNTYIETCLCASALRVKLSSKTRISTSRYNAFKKAFDVLFVLTWNMEELKDYSELLNKIKEWLCKKVTKPDEPHIQNGLEMFEDYQEALREKDILNKL